MSFVTRSGTQLQVAGAAWRFVGFNFDELCYSTTTQAQIDAWLDTMVANTNVNVVRLAFTQAFSYQGTRWSRFDALVTACKRRNLKIIAILDDTWGSFGNQYQNSIGGPADKAKGLAWYQANGDYTTWTNGGAWEPFKAYLTAIATRYANEDTIAWWEISMELWMPNSLSDQSCTGQITAMNTLRAYLDDCAATLKAADANHLVSSGASLGGGGSPGCGMNSASNTPPDYQYVHAGSVDLCSYHDYYDVWAAIAYASGSTGPGLSKIIGYAAALSKPVYIGEFGIPRDVSATISSAGTELEVAGAPNYTTTVDSLHRQAFLFRQKAAALVGTALAGICYWSRRSTDKKYGIYAGDAAEQTVRHCVDLFRAKRVA